jgi:hypothetical protein
MARQRTVFKSVKSMAPLLLGVAVLILVEVQLEAAGLQFSRFVCSLIGELLHQLPAVTFAGYQALQSQAFDGSQLFACQRSLVSTWPVLCFIAGAV